MKSQAMILMRQQMAKEMEAQPQPTFAEVIGNKMGPDAISTLMKVLKAGKGLRNFCGLIIN